MGAQRSASSTDWPQAKATTKVEEKASPAPVLSKGGFGSGYGGINQTFAPSSAYAPLTPSVMTTIFGPNSLTIKRSFLMSFSSVFKILCDSSLLHKKTSLRR